MTLPEVSSDAIFTVATDASAMGTAAVLLKDQGEGLQSVQGGRVSEIQLTLTLRTILESLAVCEAVKHWRCYLEGCSTFLVVTYHDTLRRPLMQPNNSLNKRQARYMLDLHPFVGHDDACVPQGSPKR
jgi:hypothetical protein